MQTMSIELLMSPPQGWGAGYMNIIFLVALFVVMYFFMIRPQTQKAKLQKKFWEELKKGDKVVTTGGIHGKISKLEDNILFLEVDNNINLKIDKSAISLELTNALKNTN